MGVGDAGDNVGAEGGLRVGEGVDAELKRFRQVHQIADDGCGADVDGDAKALPPSLFAASGGSPGLRQDADATATGTGDALGDGDAAVGGKEGQAGETPAVGKLGFGEKGGVFNRRRGRAFEEADLAFAAGATAAALGIDGDAGGAQGVEQGSADGDLDVEVDAFYGDANERP